MPMNIDNKHTCYCHTIRKAAGLERYPEDHQAFFVVVTRERSGYIVWDTSQSDVGEVNTIANYFPYSRDQAIEWAVDYAQKRELEIIRRWEKELAEHNEHELRDAADQGREPKFFNGLTGWYETKAEMQARVA